MGKLRRMRTPPGGRLARPDRKEQAGARTQRNRAWRAPTRKGKVSAVTRNSPGAAAESPVERRTVQETGSVSDRVHIRQTTAAHAAQDQSRRDPPGITHSGAANR